MSQKDKTIDHPRKIIRPNFDFFYDRSESCVWADTKKYKLTYIKNIFREEACIMTFATPNRIFELRVGIGANKPWSERRDADYKDSLWLEKIFLIEGSKKFDNIDQLIKAIDLIQLCLEKFVVLPVNSMTAEEIEKTQNEVSILNIDYANLLNSELAGQITQPYPWLGKL